MSKTINAQKGAYDNHAPVQISVTNGNERVSLSISDSGLTGQYAALGEGQAIDVAVALLCGVANVRRGDHGNSGRASYDSVGLAREVLAGEGVAP